MHERTAIAVLGIYAARFAVSHERNSLYQTNDTGILCILNVTVESLTHARTPE